MEWDYQVNSKTEHIGPKNHTLFKAYKPVEGGDKNRPPKRKKSPSPESRSRKKGKPKRSKDEDADLTKGMVNPDPKPNIELVDIPNIPLANQPSANIPPSTNRNLRNVQLTDLDMNEDGEKIYFMKKSRVKLQISFSEKYWLSFQFLVAFAGLS